YIFEDRIRWSKGNHLSVKRFRESFIRTYGHEREVDVFILEDGRPLRVVDVMLSRKFYSKELQMLRCAMLMEGYLSYVGLLVPKPLTEESFDTSRWRIDRTALLEINFYYTMIESLFVSDRFNLSEDCDANILSIGLGGGTVTSFLHQTFPRMDITVVEISGQMLNAARKWFGLLEDDHQRVILTDGITFLAERAKKGASYNAILLDACLPQFESDFLCPHKSFTDEDVLKNIATLLSKQGILVVNALSPRYANDLYSYKDDKPYQYLVKKFNTVFGHCERQKTGSPNQIIYCLHQSPMPKLRINTQQFLSEKANIITQKGA
ncbi:unnamed protein product, partial [Cylicocyclus nassatus]